MTVSELIEMLKLAPQDGIVLVEGETAEMVMIVERYGNQYVLIKKAQKIISSLSKQCSIFIEEEESK